MKIIVHIAKRKVDVDGKMGRDTGEKP